MRQLSRHGQRAARDFHTENSPLVEPNVSPLYHDHARHLPAR